MHILTIYWMLLQFIVPSDSANAVIKHTNEQRYKIQVNTTVSYKGIGIAHVDLFLGTLQSNQYQEVLSSNFQREASVQSFGNSGDSCIYHDIELGPKNKRWRKKLVQQTYTLSVSDISVDFSKIDTIYPYDTESQLYKTYTASNEPFIDINNSFLQHIADSIWMESSDILEYARNCYEYVPRAFQYLNPISGFHTLDNILLKGGGDCGNLSSVFITLLRMKGVPARHLVGFRPDNSLHVWADFYLEGYGWIPLDVTYEQSDPEGDYFGNITFENNGFIVHRGIGYPVQYKNGLIRIASLQTYSYKDNYSLESSRSIIIDRNVTSTKMEDEFSSN